MVGTNGSDDQIDLLVFGRGTPANFRCLRAEHPAFGRRLFPALLLQQGLIGFLPRIGVRDDFLFHELPHRLPEQFMISGEIWRPHNRSFLLVHSRRCHEIVQNSFLNSKRGVTIELLFAC